MRGRSRPNIGLRIAVLLVAAGAWATTETGDVVDATTGESLRYLSARGRHYVSVALGDGTATAVAVARLIYAVHHDGYIPSGFHVDHIDENKANDAPANLQLLRPRENTRKHVAHARRTAQINSIDQIREAKRLRAEGRNQFEISEILDCSPGWVSILTRRDDPETGPPVTRKCHHIRDRKRLSGGNGLSGGGQ